MQFLVQPLPHKSASSPLHGAVNRRYVIWLNRTGGVLTKGAGKPVLADADEEDLGQLWGIERADGGFRIYTDGKTAGRRDDANALFLTGPDEGGPITLAPATGGADQVWLVRETRKLKDTGVPGKGPVGGFIVGKTKVVRGTGFERVLVVSKARDASGQLVDDFGLVTSLTGFSTGPDMRPGWSIAVRGALPDETGDRVKLFAGAGQTGEQQALGAGSYRVADLSIGGIGSVDVPEGLRVALHATDQFRRTADQEPPFFANAGATDVPAGIRSLVVEPVVSFFEKKDFGGRVLRLPVGRHLPRGERLPGFGSLRVPVGMSVTVDDATFERVDEPNGGLEIKDVKVNDSRVYLEDDPDVGDFGQVAGFVTIKKVGIAIPPNALRFGDQIDLQYTKGDVPGFIRLGRFVLVRSGKTRDHSLVSYGDEVTLELDPAERVDLVAQQLGVASANQDTVKVLGPFRIARRGVSHHATFVSAGDQVQFGNADRQPLEVIPLGTRTTFVPPFLVVLKRGVESSDDPRVPQAVRDGLTNRVLGAPRPGRPSFGDAPGIDWLLSDPCGAKLQNPSVTLPCGIDACGAAACDVAASLVSVCGAAAAGVAVCGGYFAAASACGAAMAGFAGAAIAACGADVVGLGACGLDLCGAAVCGLEACAAAGCGAAACGTDACASDFNLIEVSGFEACATEAAAIDACPLDACAANVCGVNLCPADACAADACAVDLIPIIPFI